ncbi:MAG: Trm112 family protein [bacterium]|jgi:uncharacterized protein YbaR (Trm112 family)|nr:Trm112 family protein [bacterium]
MPDQTHPVPPELRPLFICPACQGELDWSRMAEIRCTACGRVYPIVGGIPDFVVDGEKPPA